MFSFYFIIGLPWRIVKAVWYKIRMRRFGWSSEIRRPLRINGYRNIWIGNHVHIADQTWLGVSNAMSGVTGKLVIEDGCVIGHYNHIYATGCVILHNHVLTADKVYVSDNCHGYENVDIPIVQQSVVQRNFVEIGEGSWLGENVCVLGAKIGKHCVIGANSVVTHDIPDFCVAVGNPAKIIKQFDFQKKEWVKV